MPNTAVYGLPYHALSDSPDGAALGEDLAEAVEDELVRIDTALSAATAARVATSQTETSTSYDDLSTPGPAVTVTTGTSARVTVTARIKNSGVNLTRMSFAISGATTVAADDTRSLEHEGTNWMRASATYTVTGLTPGSNTFTAKYKVAAGTGTFEDREILVEPIGAP